MSDAQADPERFAALFVEGAAPEGSERKRYRGYMFRAQPPDSVEGDEVAVKVDIEDPSTGKILGQAEWVVVRVADGQWLLKSAPLPD